MTPKNTLICTVGTSLLWPNLKELPNAETYESWLKKQPSVDQPHLTLDRVLALADAAQRKDTRAIAAQLVKLPGATRLCGAEINSINDLIEREYCEVGSSLYFCHSDTNDGGYVAEIIRHYYLKLGYPIELDSIEDLQDQDPKRFRTKGLRNLAKTVCRIIREHGAPYCAINATGGYKAQIAIGVLMGQALGVPVYYKHERFSEIIAFPPMPISLDHQLWMQQSGLFVALDRQVCLPKTDLDLDDWDERLETLVEQVEIDGAIYLELSPTGQIFHETFKGRFESERDRFLPPPVQTARKSKPSLTDHNWGHAREAISAFMQRLIDECSYVQGCRTHYWNPSISRATLFRLKSNEIEGVFSNGTWTVKIIVETSATTSGQQEACIAELNARTANWKL
ncbi:putative CRISPR-associated protein [Chromatium okenii]|jgi:putative CRISPR-associated protein (TIGR02619 family)|uniref:putative CRISPR-associated protein n=1 Tax=Chromatium okenii TaxID=61644 RepID=UPI0026EEAFE7|nr:putative CRISPR-associated protein [Chromatium okenii]MBV5310881.1 putative CRISPR-associated protein [Chromatium okenii]